MYIKNVYTIQTAFSSFTAKLIYCPCLCRFLPEEKEKRSPYQWAPFGHGPRNCVGMRLALMELKMATIGIIRNFKVVTGPETQVNVMKKMW